MQNTSCRAIGVVGPAADGSRKYGVQHESGAWYNHRIGPLVEEPEYAMSWESREIAEDLADMLSRSGTKGRFEAVPLPV